MKFIISENRVYDYILKYINSKYEPDKINWTYSLDDYGDETDIGAVFYAGDFSDDGDLFRWYSKDYWLTDDFNGENEEKIKRLVEESPILMIYSDDDYDTFENLFGNRWKPILAEWFEDNFGFPVKTIKK